MQAPNLSELKARKDVQRQRLMSGINELVDLIVTDIPAYVIRELKKAFVNNLGFAEATDDQGVVALKRSAAAFANTLAEDMRANLAAEPLWLGPDVALGEGKCLDANLPLTQCLQDIAGRTAAFFADKGLGQVELQYKCPTWFIEGRYAPGMIEKYWSQLALLREMEQEIIALEIEQRRLSQSTRWDAL